MGRAAVRTAVQAYLSGSVAGLNYVYTARPKRIPVDQFRTGQPAGTPSGCVGVVDITNESEYRRAIGGATSGKKEIQYTISIELYCHSVEMLSETAMGFFDGVVDALKARLRADRQLGDPSLVFEAGEHELAGQYGEPKVLDSGVTEIWGRITIQLSEWITS